MTQRPSRAGRVLCALAVVCLAPETARAQITWTVGYADTTAGFADPVQGQARRDTVTAVTNYLSTVLDGRWGAGLYFNTSNGPLAGTHTLARASAYYSTTSPAGYENGQLFQQTLQGAGNSPTNYDGSVRFNFQPAGGYGWYATGLGGAGTPASNQYDLYSVALHEIGHTLGLESLVNADGSGRHGNAPGTPDGYGVFARHLRSGVTGVPLFDASARYVGPAGNPAPPLVGNAVYFAGPMAAAGLGGGPVKVYAPSSWIEGSSLSHTDPAGPGQADAVMQPFTSPGVARRAFTSFEIGMLLDLGWNTFTWTAGSGNWSAGSAPLNRNASNWTNPGLDPAVYPATGNRVLPPVGTITSNLVLNFGGSGTAGYTATNDLASADLSNPFRLNRLNLASTATAANTIAGRPLRFGNDRGYTAAPAVFQDGTGAFVVTAPLDIPQGVTFTGTGTGAVTVGTVGGAGGLTKTGTFTLRLTGDGTYAGGTVVGAGALLAANDGPGRATGTGPVTVGGAGVLGGTGRVGAVTVLSGGLVAAGDPTANLPGELSAASLTLAAGATFRTQINGPAGSPLAVEADGSVSLGSATLQALLGNYTPEAGDWFAVIDNRTSQPVQGTFAGLAEGAAVPVAGLPAGLAARVTYFADVSELSFAPSGGNDVVLRIVPVPEPGAVLLLAAGGLWLARRRAARRV